MACGEALFLTLVGRVRGLHCRCDASLGARLLGMRSSALANVHCLQCRGVASCGVRMLGMHACEMS